MNRRTGAIACVVVLSLATAAWSQSTGATSTGGTTAGSGVTAAQSTGTKAAIKQQVKSEFATLMDYVIHSFFSDLRNAWGLSQTTTASTVDPLSTVENLAVEFANVWLQAQ